MKIYGILLPVSLLLTQVATAGESEKALVCPNAAAAAEVITAASSDSYPYTTAIAVMAQQECAAAEYLPPAEAESCQSCELGGSVFIKRHPFVDGSGRVALTLSVVE